MIKKLLFLLIFVAICTFNLSGCAFFLKNKPKEIADSLTDTINGTIIHDKILSQGGKLLVLPFRAGPGVEANEELDKIALMMIRGLLDVFKAHNDQAKLKIIFSENKADADFILDGFITKISKPSKWKRWIFRSKTKSLGFKGKIMQTGSITPILFFSDTIQTKDKTAVDLGLLAGKRIGDFIFQTQ